MASLRDLNHFSYLNPQLSEYQGIWIIEGVLYCTKNKSILCQLIIYSDASELCVHTLYAQDQGRIESRRDERACNYC